MKYQVVLQLFKSRDDTQNCNLAAGRLLLVKENYTEQNALGELHHCMVTAQDIADCQTGTEADGLGL